MKKVKIFLIIFLLLTFYLLLNGCTIIFKGIKDYDNVFLVYLDGANNLDDFAIKDFEEIKNAEVDVSGKNVVLVLIDRMFNDIPTYEDFDDTRLYEISYSEEGSIIKEINCKELGLTTSYIDEDLDMGNPETLAKFCRFVYNNYSAKHYFLDIWDHGGGWRNKEICSDDESETVIRMGDLRKAMQRFCPIHFDAIILDACVMANIEVASSFLDFTDYIIFSQLPIPVDGMPYDKVVPEILKDENIGDKVKNICKHYVDYYLSSEQNISISAISVDKNYSFIDFCKIFENRISKIPVDSIRQKRNQLSEIAETSVDFSVFLDNDSTLSEEFSKILLYNYPDNLSGLSIYFPEYPVYDKYFDDYNKNDVYFIYLFPFYYDFLKNFSIDGVINKDNYEPNGSKEKAYSISYPCSINSYIWCEYDLDYYKIDNIHQKKLTITLIPPDYTDYDLKVYYYIGDDLSVMQSTNLGDQKEIIEIDQNIVSKIDALYIVVIGAQAAFNKENPYILNVK